MANESADATMTKGEEDSSSGSDDSDTLERMRAFSVHNKSGEGSIRRYDEYTSFLTRSQRAHLRGKEKPLSKEEESKRKVHFRTVGDSEDVMETVHEIPSLSDDDKRRCYMTPENWDAIDTDIDLTKMRWENHQSGKLKFDEANNTTRGLESMLFPELMERKWIDEHQKNILIESNRQKGTKDYVNWEQFRKISLLTSEKEIQRAQRVALEDNRAALQCWQTKSTGQNRPMFPGDEKKKKSSSIFKKLLSMGSNKSAK